jgi:hypothetical protein
MFLRIITRVPIGIMCPSRSDTLLNSFKPFNISRSIMTIIDSEDENELKSDMDIFGMKAEKMGSEPYPYFKKV